MTTSAFPNLESLLKHESFVRAVVRGLVADESRLQDVLQETWLRALRRPPRATSASASEEASRGWLARVARNVARDEHRRAFRSETRERAVAREEATESVAATQERLEAQREVVDAVLALEDPYRSVVLLHYYQELDAGAIAERLGRSPSTVRSQLSRAHERLRRVLDERCMDGRAGWVALAAPGALPGGTAGAKFGGTWFLTGVVAVTLASTMTFVLVPRLSKRDPSGSAFGVEGMVSAEDGEAAQGMASEHAMLIEVAGRRPAVQEEPGEPGEVETAPASWSGRARMEDRSVQELFELAVQLQREIEERVLTPQEALAQEHADVLTMTDAGLCRVLDGNGTESAWDDSITVRGGGAYYSFATGEHSYNAEPDLSFHKGRFKSGFYGRQLGLLLELGMVPLTDLESSPNVPVWLEAERISAWHALWKDITEDDSKHRSSFREATKELGRSIAAGAVGTTYLLRMHSPREHDHLVAFQIASRDEEGCTLLWRILQRWAVADRRGPSARFDDSPQVPDGPAWLGQVSLDDLLGLLAQARALAHPRLMVIPEELVAKYGSLVQVAPTAFGQREGFGRLLQRGRCEALVSERGGGAYYSFFSQSNSYNDHPDLGLGGDMYTSGFAGGDRGLLLDLGQVPFAEVGQLMAGELTATATEVQRAAWNFLWNVRATTEESGRRRLEPADEERAGELGISHRLPARVGHTYALRTALFTHHDHLVVFTVVDGDDFGHTLAWRVLKSFPVEPRKR